VVCNLALATLNFGAAYLQWGNVLAWSAGVVMALLLFGSVLLHELGHSLVARSQGIKVKSITCFSLAGLRQLKRNQKALDKPFK
jgi:Zn-dependent protease